MDDRKAGYVLYKEGATQKEIAKTLGRTEKTISNWKKADEWDKHRATSTLQENTIKDHVYELIQYQLSALQKIKEGYEKEGGTALIARGDIDGLSKLFTAVKEKELEWSQLVKAFREFMEWLKLEDIELAKELTAFIDNYLNIKRQA